ncbi:unnamed protein product [Lampetra fluviatilis]
MKCHRGQDFAALRDAALAHGGPFEDPCFPAGPTSLGYDKLGPCSRFSEGIVWMRPWEITSDPQFIVRGASRFDLCQGKLGDCWFLAAISSLTLNERLLGRVVPMQQGFGTCHSYAGIFHFRFWRYGEWVDVVVDDRLPTLKGKLAFVRSCESNEFWGALLEKAYAKVCGSYEALRSGRFTEALVDFTGGVKEHYLLGEAPPPHLWLFLKRAENAGSLMGRMPRTRPEQKTRDGLVLGHAYSITGVERVKVDGEVVELVRLRNPWGKVEWNGTWSDSSPVWKCVDCDAKRKLQVKLEDGEFWMSMEDFRRHFKRLDVCHLTPDDVQNGPRKTWTVTMYQGSWQAGHSAGGTCKETFWKNPQYLLDLHEADAEQEEGDGLCGCGCGCGDGESALCSLIVSLMQKPRDAQRNRAPWFSIGFAIYKVVTPLEPHLPACGRRLSREELRAAVPVALLERFEALREVSQRLLLPAGRYVVIPCSLQPGEAADFLLRVFCCSCDSSEYDATRSLLPVLQHEQYEGHLLRAMWSELFQQHASPDRSIGPAELQAVLYKAASKYPATVSQSFSSGTCQKIIILLNKSVSSKLASREFEILSHKFTEIHDLYRRFRLHSNAAPSLQSVHRGLYKAGLPVSGDLERHTLLRYLGGKRRIDFEDFLCCLLHIDALSGTVKAILQRPDIQPEQKEWMKRIMFF